MKVKSLSCVQLFAMPWTVVYQTVLSIEFSRQEYWNGLPFPSPEGLPDSGIEPGSPTLLADRCFTVWATLEVQKTEKNKVMPFAGLWIDLEIIIPSEVGQKEKHKPLICGIFKKWINELIYKIELDPQR